PLLRLHAPVAAGLAAHDGRAGPGAGAGSALPGDLLHPRPACAPRPFPLRAFMGGVVPRGGPRAPGGGRGLREGLPGPHVPGGRFRVGEDLAGLVVGERWSSHGPGPGTVSPAPIARRFQEIAKRWHRRGLPCDTASATPCPRSFPVRTTTQWTFQSRPRVN